MATATLGTRNFLERTRTGITVIEWWADWCAPCRAFAPTFEAASQRHPDVRFARIDTDAEPELADALGVEALPLLMILREGILVFERAGVLPGPALDGLVEAVRALDLEDVRNHAVPRCTEVRP